MLYDPLSHLSSLYAAAIDSLKDQPFYPEIVSLGDSVLGCLGSAYRWDELRAGNVPPRNLTEASKRLVGRMKKIHLHLNPWVDARQYLRLLLACEVRWQRVVRAALADKDVTLETLGRESEHRQTQLRQLFAALTHLDQEMRERYAEPVAL